MDDIESEEDIAADVGYGGLSLEEDKRWNWGCQNNLRWIIFNVHCDYI